MGYDLDYFIGPVDDELMCPICNGVLEKPLQIFPCEHCYCGDCLRQWFESNSEKRCPNDREVVYDAFIKAPRVINNFLAKLEMKCNFSDKGCEEILKLEFLETHTSTCLFNPDREMTCHKCGVRVVHSKLDNHKCERRLSQKLKRKNCILM